MTTFYTYLQPTRFGWTFAPGDKVMQIENDYDKEVYNGDVGYIVGRKSHPSIQSER